MQGFNCLFQPGYDHAGIATQTVVEKELETEGRTRQELGREAFEARVWEWLRRYGRTIMTQFRRMGASMDYRRERFTMDDGYVRAVHALLRPPLASGWLYRDNRISTGARSTRPSLSDLELDHVEVDDELVYVRYPLADGSGHVTIATVRPATILADVAVAVHPEDERYRDLVGKEVDRALRRAARAGDRRRARRARVRHRRAQGDARPRPDRLRDRPRARPARADGDRPRRAHERARPASSRG